MSLYEDLVINNKHIPIDDGIVLKGDFEGFYDNGVILIDKNLSETRKAEVLFEELAHHKLTYGNILDQSKWINRKFESYARRHGYEAALPLRIIVEAHHYGVNNLYELAQYVQRRTRIRNIGTLQTKTWYWYSLRRILYYIWAVESI